jgi:hypothetical protein
MLCEEAARVRAPRDAGEDPGLVLGELLRYQVPGGFATDVQLVHPAVLWVLDRDKDGRFSDKDIIAFADEMGEYTTMWLREEVGGGMGWGWWGEGRRGESPARVSPHARESRLCLEIASRRVPSERAECSSGEMRWAKPV